MRRLLAPAVAALAMSPLTGCVAHHHRSAPAIHLQDVAGYPLLVPGHAAAVHGPAQTTSVLLGRPDLRNVEACAVHGAVFSLEPQAQESDVWTLTSPSASGWQAPTAGLDFRSQWLDFLRSVAALQTAGCFAPGWNFPRAQQAIADAMPVPADDALVFLYAFTGTEAIDLFPGMQVQVEHSVYGIRKGQRELQSMEGDYEVVVSGSGVALRRVRAVTLHQPATQQEIFHLDSMTSGAPMLRLFLQSVDTAVHRQPMLLAASNAQALAQATERAQAVKASACDGVVPGVRCIAFHSGVSLLLASRWNGRLEYHAPGTALSQLLDEKHADVRRVTLRRRQADGRYALVVFPATDEAARRLILQNGDEITLR